MIRLVEVDESNWLEINALRVSEDQQGFLDRAVGIVARGYAYRNCNARVIGIADEKQLVGMALVKDMDEEPACYDLQQFMIDQRFQNRGYGTEALRLILRRLQQEGKYTCVEVCVKQADTAALRVYGKLGFVDTGYVDDCVPDCLNLVYRFREESGFSDTQITDFSDELFQNAFRQYFSELGVRVSDWDAVFREMNEEGDNSAFVRRADGGKTVGFTLFRPITFTSSFFEETAGFIREIWVSDGFRNAGHGAALLGMAERYFRDHGICNSILTTDTAGSFYEKRGYRRAPGCRARNRDEVFVKRLK